MAGSKSKKNPPPPKTLLSFFRPSPAPGPPRAGNPAPRTTPTPLDKGKRKAEVVELSSDSEVEIVEPKPKLIKVARKEVERVREVQEREELRAGPSKVLAMKEEQKGGSDPDKGFTVEQLIEAALPAEERSEIGERPPHDEAGAAEEDYEGPENGGEGELMQVEERSQWGDDEVEGGEWDPDGGGEPEDWGEESMRMDEGDPFAREEEAIAEDSPEDEDIVVQGSSKDLDAPPPSGEVCPICSKDLSLLISDNVRSYQILLLAGTDPSSAAATPATRQQMPRQHQPPQPFLDLLPPPPLLPLLLHSFHRQTSQALSWQAPLRPSRSSPSSRRRRPERLHRSHVLDRRSPPLESC